VRLPPPPASATSAAAAVPHRCGAYAHVMQPVERGRHPVRRKVLDSKAEAKELIRAVKAELKKVRVHFVEVHAG
jgi:hypothetical protein